MKSRTVVVVGGIFAASGWSVSAGIPEPDVILFGTVCIHGQPQQATDTGLVVRATATVGGQERIVGEYRMGDNALAASQYVLRIRRESGADGSVQSIDAARAGQTIHVRVQHGADPPLEAASFTLPELGTIQRRALAVGTAGIDSDADNDLADFAKLQRCFTGAGGFRSSQCAAADLDGDNDVDLGDFQNLSEAIPGPCS